MVLACFAISGSVHIYAQNAEVVMNKSSRGSYPNEPSICINKKNPARIIAGANINYHFFSTDSGKTFSNYFLKSPYGVYGDPVLHSDIDGNIYFAHLSQTAGKDKNYGWIDRMVVQTAIDGGYLFNDGGFAGLNEPKVQDKPWLSTDDYSDKYKGDVYLTWTEFDYINSKKDKYHSRIRFSKSSDKGQNWSDAITISDSVGDALDDDHTLEGATTAVDKNGTIYCVWAGHNKIYFDKSADGGKTWGKDKIIFNQHSGWVIDIPHTFRSNGMPFLAIDNSNGPNSGRLYLVWGDDYLGDADIFFSYSDDGGKTWVESERLNLDAVGNGKSQYLPNIAVDATSGHIAMVYLDRRNSENNFFNDATLSYSTDGGISFSEHKLNTLLGPSSGQQSFSGDYIDIDFHNGQIAAIWTNNLSGKPVVCSQVLFENDLTTLPAIVQPKQTQISSSLEKKQFIICVGSTGKTHINYKLYSKNIFGKKKLKKTEDLYINHKPELEAHSETLLIFGKKQRIEVEIWREETGENPVLISTIRRN